jgi:hypothetical protein
VSSKAMNPKGPVAEHQRHGPCDPTLHDGSSCSDAADSNANYGKATFQETRAIASLERWLESVKATAKAREKHRETAQSFSKARDFKTMPGGQVIERITTCRKAPPAKATRHGADLPSDGWVRIVSNLHISALNVEMWLRIDCCSGYIEEFRIGPKPLTP